MNLEVNIEAVLFYKAEPVKKASLMSLFAIDAAQLQTALQKLSERLTTGGTRIIETDVSVQLVTAPDCADVIEALRKDELANDIGKAGAETLAIILYRGPLSRAEIDRIRGVNSTFILRNLMIRGLIERRDNPKDQRSYLYAGTPDLLAHLGITAREELPDFARIMNALDEFELSTKAAEADKS